MAVYINFDSITLGIGEIKIIRGKKAVVWTVLGSCISVVFYANKNLSLICHAQMPDRGLFESKCSDSCPHPCFNYLQDSNEFKFVNCAIEYMIRVMENNNINLKKISTAVIGGASLFKRIEGKKTIGEQNIEKAEEVLGKHGIKINRSLVGGNEGYTIWFYSNNNKIIYKRHTSEQKYEL